ncbi:MAG: diaminopimelate epimerase [Chloroflexota bacterium]|nr:diaminopimelate epimerase [Chloroflexota bacterium]
MRFTKLHGAGNDYLFVDARGLKKDWPPVRAGGWPALSRAMSDRHFGAGADGLILALPGEVAPLRMRMFNADGSEAEMCGNGVRCLVKFAIERGIAHPEADGFVDVETLAGLIRVKPIYRDGRMAAARVNMGTPRLAPAEVPVNVKGPRPVLDHPLTVDGVELRLAFVSMGNPHAVAFIETPVADFPLHTIGPKVEHHPLFPRRVNFEIVNVADRGHLRQRTWERGSGETQACSTGASAVAVAARLKGLTGDSVDIMLPGGVLKLEWPGHGDVWLEGPAEEVYTAEWPD